MSITVDSASAPSQSPLGGAKPGIAVKAMVKRLSDQLGYQVTNPRFRAAAITWIQDTLLEIQLADAKMRRTMVLGASFTTESGTSDYDVRQLPFGWSNCYAVAMLRFTDLNDKCLESVTPEQYRNRGVLAAESGAPGYFVKLDQFRVRFVPTPDQVYAGEGDYQQDIPQIANDDDRVDWPRAWDIVLQEGTLYRGFRWRSEQDPTWGAQRRVFRELLAELKSTEAVMLREPGKCVVLRTRTRSVIPHDNSADVGRRRR